MTIKNKLLELIHNIQQKYDQHDFERVGVLVVAVMVLTAIMSTIIYEPLNPENYRVGNIAMRSIRSPVEFQVEDRAASERLRLEKENSVKRVFTFEDNNPDLDVTTVVENLFAYLEKIPLDPKDPGRVLLDDAERRDFEKKFDVDLGQKEWDLLATKANWPDLRESLILIIEPVMQKGIVAHREALRIAINTYGAVIRKRSNNDEQIVYTIAGIYDIKEAQKAIERNIKAAQIERTAYKSTIEKLAAGIVQPNVIFDNAETELRLKSARDSVPAVNYTVRRGQMIVRAGDQLREDQELKIIKLYSLRDKRDYFRLAIGYAILISLILVTVYSFTIRVWPTFKPRNRDLMLISIVLIASVALFRAFSILGDSLSLHVAEADSSMFALMTPLATGGILLQVTLGPAGVFLYLMSLSLLTGIFLDDSWIFLLYIIIGNIVGAVCVRECSRRSAFLIAGIRVAAINVLVISCFFILYPQYSSSDIIWRIFFSLAGGILSGLFATGLTPIAEHIGSYTTNIKLLELASLDRPLLRELSLQAPGTWNHSVIMSQIGEAAAEAIGANPILVRVAGYYHDIGKLKKPNYFIENQAAGENKHDKLAPSMSALIIKSHVKDGIEMAKKVGLPETLINLIPQHHGTALISYFYEKAKQEAAPDEEVNESHYRYLGPKPQTKEAGIIMLSDGVEAASRTLTDPSPARIQGLVQKLINKVFISGQLDESELTLNDLHQIAKQFTRVLTAIHHRRIEYAEKAYKHREAKVKEEIGHEEEKSEHEAKTTDTISKRNGSKRGIEVEGSKTATEGTSKKTGDIPNPEALRRLGM